MKNLTLTLRDQKRREIESNHPRCKKGWPRTKTGLAEKDMKSKRQSMPSGFDRFESFGHDELTAKHLFFQNIVISCAQGILMLIASKFLIKMTRPQKTKIKNSVLWPGHLHQKV